MKKTALVLAVCILFACLAGCGSIQIPGMDQIIGGEAPAASGSSAAAPTAAAPAADASASSSDTVTIWVRDSEETIMTDSYSGEQTYTARIYYMDAPVVRPDGIIEVSGYVWGDSVDEYDVVFFYTADGRFIGMRSYTDESTDDYLAIAELTLDDYLNSLEDVESIQDDVIYFTDGEMTVLSVRDGMIYGEDCYNSDGMAYLHWYSSHAGQDEELWFDYSPDIGDYLYKINYYYTPVDVILP